MIDGVEFCEEVGNMSYDNTEVERACHIRYEDGDVEHMTCRW